MAKIISKLKIKQIESDLGDSVMVSWAGIPLHKMNKKELIILLSYIEQKRKREEKEKNALLLHNKLSQHDTPERRGLFKW